MSPHPLAPALLALLVPLSACGPAPLRLAVPPADAGAAVPIGFASVEVIDVSLPAYAEGEEISIIDIGDAPVPGSPPGE